MLIDVLTIFPEMFKGVLDYSIIARAQEKKLVEIRLHNIRDYATDAHRTVDDYPYGGGSGMVMKPEPIFRAVEEILHGEKAAIILLTPRGRLLTQDLVKELSSLERMVLICGRYEGVDERVAEYLATEQVSIGDYVLSGGEIPAMVIIDAVTRLIPGALGSLGSVLEDSHSSGLLEYPQYTRPADFRGLTVPPILLSGDHAKVAQWRRQMSLLHTAKVRPELLKKANLEKSDKIYLTQCGFGDLDFDV